MNINNFEDYLPPSIVSRGYAYYTEARVEELDEYYDNCFSSEIEGSELYVPEIELDDDGTVLSWDCDCPYGDFCKHLVAMMYEIRDVVKFPRTAGNGIKEAVKKDSFTGSSVAVRNLIKKYNEKQQFQYYDSEEKAEVVPVLYCTYNRFQLELMIGRDRKYVVKDISKFKLNFEHELTEKYGKNFSFRHSYDNVDEKSRKLVELVTAASAFDSGYRSKSVEISAMRFRTLAEIFNGEEIKVNDTMRTILPENPDIVFKISEHSKGVYRVSVENSALWKIHSNYFGYSVWINSKNHTLYAPSEKFSSAVSQLFTAAVSDDKLTVSEADMPVFYSAVLKSAEKYCTVKGKKYIENILPPECEPKLYLDTDDFGMIKAKLEFCYGENTYPAFDDKNARICDYEKEHNTEEMILDIFGYPVNGVMSIVHEDKIFRFFTETLEVLTKKVEVFASDKFRKVSVRPQAKPVIEVDCGVDLLEVKISCDEYSDEELIEILNAYRKGVKYHRLRDGSFVSIGSELEELDSITSNLNISDKALLKEKIDIPFYRMLYLDNLSVDNDALRIERSLEFRRSVNEYRMMADDKENIKVPEQLGSIMRSYQKYGFRWMKTISSYRFGGILADDMGLGKTLQAISLIKDSGNSDAHLPNLVVCPASLTLNWENEIKKFAPELTVLVLNGNAAERKELIGSVSEYDVIVIPYSLIGRDIAELENVQFNMCFIDEAQYIKNHNTQTSKAVKGIRSKVRFALTGTPVENSLAELWSIFDFIMPGYLFNYTYFKKNFETPVARNRDKNKMLQLQKLVSPFILRRMKKEVLKELPEKTETVLYANMTGEQRKLYSANALNAREMLKETDETEKIKMLAMLTRLRQLCCDPSLVYEDYKKESAKLELCLELIEESIGSGHKLLLFSQFTSMLDIISDELEKREISYFMLTGSTKPKDRINMVDRFNQDDTNVFLISLKAGGTGLNLTGADIVIHYDPWWNVSAENQASDRVHRIGQKNNVQIYKLITRDTIEEKICELQKLKAEIADIALSGEGDIMRMSSDDIMSLLEFEE